ncbi:hypothetical protein AX15_005303 [Amanita polypyramis BW_CC]|nr:hypothetical protein AX15_005303 [Amanita polypyramis BW_CC]
MPPAKVYPRSNSVSININPIYIAGLTAVGATVVGLLFWFVLRILRKRAARKREENMGAAFLSVRGVVRDKNTAKKHSGGLYAIPNTTFSRSHVDSSIIIPEKALVRRIEPANGEAFIQHSESVVRTFSPRPFSLATMVSSSSPEPLAGNETYQVGGSALSVENGRNRFSVLSNHSQGNTTGGKRKVQQLFNPVMPDELLISTPGEQLTLIQSYDDGWCLVGRDNSIFGSTAKSLFKQNPMTENNIELGVVPAWCFIKPVKGLRVERPLRSSSLGISVQLQGPGFSSRDEVISWSNF